MGTVNPDQLEAEANALLNQVTGKAAPAPKADSAPEPKPEVPPQPQAQPEPPAQVEPPSPQEPPAPAQPNSELQSLQDRLTNTQAAFHAKCEENAELNRKLDALAGQVQQLQQLQQQPPQVPSTPTEPDKYLATIREDYGDDLAQALQAQRQSIKQELDAVKAQFQQQQEQVTAQQHNAAIEARHPDAHQIATSQAFNNWLIGQPPYVQAVIQSGTSADVIAVLDQFKAQQGTAPNRLETAKKVADPNVRANPTSPNPQSQPMSALTFLEQQPKGWLNNPENEAKFDQLVNSGQLILS